MRHLLIAMLGFALSGLSCAKKERTYAQDYIPAAVSEDAVPTVSRRPTNPDGGKVPGKLAEMDPEESAKRKARNEIQPLEFGLGAAGITMQTPQSQARSILSAPLGVSQGVEFYNEHIRVMWSSSGDDPMPSIIIVDEGYPGSLGLPAPFERLKVGDSLSGSITSEEQLLAFMRLIGAQFERADPKTYQCDVILTCRMLASAEGVEMQFRRGGLLIGGPNLQLQLIYFIPPQKFYPRLSAPIVYGTSIGGVSFTTRRAQFEATYGPPEALNDGIFYYDQSSIGIQWAVDGSALYIAGLRTLQGTMDFGATIGQRKIGDSFAAHFAPEDEGQLFMLALDRHFEARAPDFDCSAQEAPLCSLQKVGNFLVIMLERGTFIFTADASKNFLLYEMFKE